MKNKKQNCNFSQKYVKKVKRLFPFIRHQEKRYLKKMKQHLDDYCECSTVSSMKELYKEFGNPRDVVSDYISTMNLKHFLFKMRFHRIAKYFFMLLVILVAYFVHNFICNRSSVKY